MTAGLTSVHDVVLVGGSTHIKFSTQEKRFTRVGGLVFDTHGRHFANALEGRDYVIGEMWKNEPPFSLTLNTASF